MSTPESTEQPVAHAAPASAGRRVIGVILLVVGISMTLVSGLCTVGMTIGDMTSGGGGGGEVNLSGIQFIIGGPFILIGALMWWGGHRLAKPRIPAGAKPDGGSGLPPT